MEKFNCGVTKNLHLNTSAISTINLTLLPEVALEKIFSFLTYDEIAKNRRVCKKFNQVGSKWLTRGFLQLEREHQQLYKRVKASLPRRESERRNHAMARHNDILQGLDTRLSMLNMTYMRYIDMKLCGFIPGKVLDELKSVLKIVAVYKMPPKTHELLQELRDLSSMAIEHFDDIILPKLKEKTEFRRNPLFHFTNKPFQLASTSKQAADRAITTKFTKIKAVVKVQKSYIETLKRNTAKMHERLRRHSRRLKVQETRLSEQDKRFQEQNAKIQDQETALVEIKKHVDDWEQRYKNLTSELIRARDELLAKSGPTQRQVAVTTHPMPSVSYTPNIKPRAATLLPKNYGSNEQRKRKHLNVMAEIPFKRTNKSSISPQKFEDVELVIPERPGATSASATMVNNNSGSCSSSNASSFKESDVKEWLSKSIGSIDDILPMGGLSSIRKRKMLEDLDLK